MADIEHSFSQLFSSQNCFSKQAFFKKMFLLFRRNKMLYIQNWWTIPLGFDLKKKQMNWDIDISGFWKKSVKHFLSLKIALFSNIFTHGWLVMSNPYSSPLPPPRSFLLLKYYWFGELTESKSVCSTHCILLGGYIEMFSSSRQIQIV